MGDSLKLAPLPGPSPSDTFSLAGGRWQKFVKFYLWPSSLTLYPLGDITEDYADINRIIGEYYEQLFEQLFLHYYEQS